MCRIFERKHQDLNGNHKEAHTVDIKVALKRRNFRRLEVVLGKDICYENLKEQLVSRTGMEGKSELLGRRG